ncbi:MAG: putative Ig domain-containing protein [Pseudomonadales bacterium]|nr:putative Ig domain-containing protein [Pseudomonadales bacterium]
MYAAADWTAKGVKFGIEWLNKQNIGKWLYEWLHPDGFNRAKSWAWPRDPLVLDLDGDGFETVGLGSIHFDHDGDGVLTRTGWVGRDDALLVRDRSANGGIDTGAELFGDFTPLSDGTLAANGFAALAALDTGGDGKIDANDPAFAELRLWQDANQDGSTDAGELIALADAGIASLDLAHTLRNQDLANGNQLAREGSFTRSDGTTAPMGEFGLATDTFSTRFAVDIEVPEALRSLPNMGGAGNVRELQQAAATSASLLDVLGEFQSATTRVEQKALLDELLTVWANTSGMARNLEERAAGKYRIQYEAFGDDRRSANVTMASSVITGPDRVTSSASFLSDADDPQLSEAYRNAIAEWNRKLHVLEAFNGQYFFNLPTQKSQTSGANWGLSISSATTASSNNGGAATFLSLPILRVNLAEPQLDLLQQAYDVLKENVYASLAMQTRLKPYLDQIAVVIDDAGVRLDATLLNQALTARKLADPQSYLSDVLDLDRYASGFLSGSNWRGLADFDSVLESLPDSPDTRALLAEFGLRRLGSSDDIAVLPDSADLLLAGDGNDSLYGLNGNDRLFGEGGDDRSYGGYGNDLLSGGAGDDQLHGEAGADLYVFGRGFGHDVIHDTAENGVRRDRVHFTGLAPADVGLSLDPRDALIFTVLDTGESLSIPRQGYAGRHNGVGQYVFDDGTTWSHDDALRATVAASSDGNDVIHGSPAPEPIVGLAGNDVLIGNAGDDVIDGSSGNDLLIGSSGWHRVLEDGVYRQIRSTTPTIDANGNDSYLFGRGDGLDTVLDGDSTPGNVDTLHFRDAVAPADVKLSRQGEDLILAIRDTDDRVTLRQYFHTGPRVDETPWLIEHITFADGTRWTLDDVQAVLFAGSEDAETIVGSRQSDTLSGLGGDDTLLGEAGDDGLQGGAGDDRLFGGAAHDILDGGAGNDVLYGGADLTPSGVIRENDGSGDAYRFGRGDGHDIVIDDSWLEAEGDRIELKSGLTADDVRLERVVNRNGWRTTDDLKFTIRDTGETLLVRKHFDAGNRYAIEEITFSDGTLWDAEAIRSRVLLGDAGNDVLSGFNDRDDVLAGAGGDDVLAGGSGSDTYLSGFGDGNDVIDEGDTTGEDAVELESGVAPNDVTIRWTLLGDMRITLADGSGLGVRRQSDDGSGRIGIEQLRFADGTRWSRDELAQRAIAATAGDDFIVGGRGDDILDGGSGNDRFQDRGGYDSYLFGLGDGHDVIADHGGRIVFKTGIGPNDAGFSHDGNDLIVTVATSGDSLRIADWLGDRERLDSFEFANGARLDSDDVLGTLHVDEDTEILYGSPGADTLTGSDKHSTIHGREGDDILTGGAGSDHLYGDESDDTLEGGPDRDELFGGSGNNTYILERGSALDWAFGESLDVAGDTVVFAAGIRPEDVSVQLGDAGGWWDPQPGDVGYDSLVIGFGGNDALIVGTRNGDDLARGAIQQFRFDDGTTWTLSDLIARADDGKMGWQQREQDDPLTILGSQADDSISDYSGQSVSVQARGNDDYITLAGGDSRVAAGTGNDYIGTGAGDDLIAGEVGDDEIMAGDGDDVIGFNHGDGHDRLGAGDGTDTLSLGATITPAMLGAASGRDGSTVLPIDGGAGGTITLLDCTADDPAGGLERIQFIDGQGSTRIFDLVGWLRANAAALATATAESPLAFDGTGFELSGRTMPAGGLEVVAYAQTGDLFATAHPADNSASDGNDALYGTPGDDALEAGAGNDVVIGLAGGDTILGGDGDDLLDGGDGDDLLDGGASSDILYGGRGADTLLGSSGHDELHGGWGGDTYLYRAGDGITIVDDEHRALPWSGGGEAGPARWYEGERGYADEGDYSDTAIDEAPNILQLGPGIRAQDLRHSEQDGDLLIEFANSPADRLILRGYEPGRATRTRSIDIIRFDDGSEIVAETIEASGRTEAAHDDGGALSGTPFADTLIGGAGDDWLEGGGGSDRLLGGAGSDTYLIHQDWHSAPLQTSLFESWREQDFNRIVLTGNVSADALHLAFDGGELLLRLNEAADAIRFAGFDPRAPGMQAPVAEVSLPGEDTTFSFDELLQRGIRIIGTAADDVLEGTRVADWFEGREADDAMHGGAGGDLYLIDADAGLDTITDSEDGDAPNVLVLPDGTTLDDLRLSCDDEGFLIVDLIASGNRIRLSGFDRENPLGPRAIERFRFGVDGDEITYGQLLGRGFDLVGSDESEVLTGTALADRIRGRDGNDLIEATPGGDWLAGEAGNDTYVIGLGDGTVTIDDVSDEAAGNVLRFGPGISADALRNRLRFEPDGDGGHALCIAYGEGDDVLRLGNFDPQDALGRHAVESVEFTDGTAVDYATLVSWMFVVEGDSAANALTGTNVGDRLYGYDGDDLLEAGAGDDVLTAGAGNDLLRGGRGRDAYVLNPGDGEDTIEDTADAGIGNVLSFGAGIRREDLRVEIEGDDLLVRYGSAGDVVRVTGYAPQGAGAGTVVDTFEFEDRTTLTLREFMNRAPTLTQSIDDHTVYAGAPFELVLPAGLFSDPEGDAVLLRVGVTNHDNLPHWLQYDAATRTLYGTPQNDDAGEFDIVIQGTDGLGASNHHGFHVSVRPDAPDPDRTPLAATDNATVIEDRKLFALGNVLTNDSDPEARMLQVADPGVRLGEYGLLALLPNGGFAYVLNNLLPAVQGLGTGEALVERFGYTASNGSARSASELIVTVNGTNDVPRLGHALPDVQLARGKAFAWQLPANTFGDRDRNDTLSYSATLANGKPLPAWLAFDPGTQSFSGKVPGTQAAGIDVRVTASDGNGPGSSASDVFRISVGSKTVVPSATASNSSATAYAEAAAAAQNLANPNAMPSRPNLPEQRATPVRDDDLLDRFLQGFARHEPPANGAKADGGSFTPWQDFLRAETFASTASSEQNFARCWSELTEALSRLDAQRLAATAWSSPSLGADIGALAGWLSGSNRSAYGGVNEVSLLAAGAQLRQFTGLREGVRQLAG